MVGPVRARGSGHGRWSERLIDRAGVLVCCDISPNCLDACRRRLAGRGRFRSHLSQGADLPEDLGAAVDAVWSYDCFVHLHPRECEAYIAEIARVLKPGAVAVIHHADRGRADTLRRALARFGSTTPTADHGWRAPVSRRDVARWARRSGLAVVRQEREWVISRDGVDKRMGVPRFGDCMSILQRPRAAPTGRNSQ